MKIAVLYGTETGNAAMLADDIKSALDGDHDVACADLAEIDPASLDGQDFHVIVCSTYGDGDVPASAKPFMTKLEALSPKLSHVRFAIFGLGDSEYAETFAHGSMKLAEALVAREAVQIGTRLTHNATADGLPEDIALPWIRAILADLEDAA